MAVLSYRTRIFLTCWLIFALHFAAYFVHEHYLVLSIGDNFSFQFAGYEGLHDYIFTTGERGMHHDANPGAFLVAVVPHLVSRPLIHVIELHERGLDIKFGLTGLVTRVFCLAPQSALGAVVIFSIFIWPGLTRRLSVWLELPFMVLAAALVYGVWRIGAPGANLVESQHESRESP
jgi:hypothetical protein